MTMMVALPRLITDLGISTGAGQWLTTAYMLTMAVVIPVTGFLIQRLATRTTYALAMGLFLAGTVVCAAAPGFAVLLAGRVVQAAGTAVLMPLLMTAIMTVTPREARGRTMGRISIVISVAPALGPTAAGLVLGVLGWRWLFILLLPVVVPALVLGRLRLPNLSEMRRSRVDVLSVVVSAVAFGGIVFGLSRFGEAGHGTGAATAWGPLAAGAGALGVFVVRQLRLQRDDRALLDLRTFVQPTFRLSVALIAVSFMSLFGTAVLLPLYAQTVLGLRPVEAGLLTLPGGLLMGVLAPWVGAAYDRFGPRVLVVPGAVLVSASAAGLALATRAGSVLPLLVGQIVLGIGLALLLTPLFTMALGSVPQHLYSHGSATVGTLQQVAGAAGIAVLVTVMTARASALTATGTDAAAATSEGVYTALLVGAAITVVAVPAAFRVRAPENTPATAVAPH
jgi:DHA2 family lincomycin resistance protein-like MFS transporter